MTLRELRLPQFLPLLSSFDSSAKSFHREKAAKTPRCAIAATNLSVIISFRVIWRLRDVLSAHRSNARAIRRSLSFATARVKTARRCTRSVASAAHPSNAWLKRRELKRRTHRSKRWRRRARAVVSYAHAAKAEYCERCERRTIARRSFWRRTSASRVADSHAAKAPYCKR